MLAYQRHVEAHTYMSHYCSESGSLSEPIGFQSGSQIGSQIASPIGSQIGSALRADRLSERIFGRPAANEWRLRGSSKTGSWRTFDKWYGWRYVTQDGESPLVT